MAKVVGPEILNDIGKLAEFANLEERELDGFKTQNTGFVPKAWWSEKTIDPDHLTLEVQWKYIQRKLREAWQEHFPINNTVQLIEGGSTPDELFEWRQSPLTPYHGGTIAIHAGDQSAPQILEILKKDIEAGKLPKPPQQVWPYQRAVMFLAIESWRARFCPQCGRRFAADIPGRRFCSSKCAGAARRGGQNAWWREHGEQWRANRKRKSKRSKR